MRGGRYPETASLASVLADGGVMSPADERPYSEAMVLGLGGGLGAGYILWEFQQHSRRIVTLGFSMDWQYPERWTERTASRLGVRLSVDKTSSANAATLAMDAAFAAGRRPIVWVDAKELGTWPMPESMSGIWGYPVVLIGRSGDDPEIVLVDERGEEPMRVSAARLATARGRIGSYKHMQFSVAETEPLTLDRLRTAVREAVVECADHLAKPSDSFSLPAWGKWARMLTDRKNAKGWPRVFADGSGLFRALVSVTEAIDGGIGSTGGHLRGLYADFLTEAAALLDDGRLDDAAARWRDAADLWDDLSDAVVPPDLPDGLDAIEADEAVHAAVMEGEAGRDAAAQASERLWAISDRHAGSFPLTDERRDEHFADLARRVRAIHEAEIVAREALPASVR
jgi:Domain of unknown function (DUF4872)/Butirosin biosynthesis protein H, N-terminal